MVASRAPPQLPHLSVQRWPLPQVGRRNTTAGVASSQLSSVPRSLQLASTRQLTSWVPGEVRLLFLRSSWLLLSANTPQRLLSLALSTLERLKPADVLKFGWSVSHGISPQPRGRFHFYDFSLIIVVSASEHSPSRTTLALCAKVRLVSRVEFLGIDTFTE